MKLNRLDNEINRENRAKLNENMSIIENDFSNMKIDVKEYKETVEENSRLVNQANLNASSALILANSVQEELDSIVVEGDSSVEAAQARTNSNTGETYSSLRARLDDENKVITQQLTQIAVNLKDFGAHSITEFGYEDFDSSQALRDALAYVTANHLKLTTDADAVYLIDNVVIENKSNFSVDSKAVFKRKDDLEVGDNPTSTLTFYNCSNFSLIELNFDGNHYNNHAKVNLPNGETYNGSHFTEFRHCLQLINSHDFDCGVLRFKNPCGDGIFITGAKVKNVNFNTVFGESVDANGNYIALGRNLVSILQGQQLCFNVVKSYGIGHITMPGGLDIEPDSNGGPVSDVSVNDLYIESQSMSALGITTKYFNGDWIKNVTLDNVTIKNTVPTDGIRPVIITGATNIKINKLNIEASSGAYAVHVGIAGTSQPVYDLKINDLRVNGCRFGVMADNLNGGHIKLNCKNAKENFLRLYKINDFDFDVTGEFAVDAVTTADCVLKVAPNNMSNCRISGDLSKSKVNGGRFAINTPDNAYPNQLVNTTLINLNLIGWSEFNVFSGLSTNKLQKVACIGIGNATVTNNRPTGDVLYTGYTQLDITRNKMIMWNGTEWVENVDFYKGNGSPNGVVTATVGAEYLDLNAQKTYKKVGGSGNTGWKEVTLV